MKEINGNLIELTEAGEFDVIVHGCNCFCTMGADVALQIKQAFPDAYNADLRTVKGDRGKLGMFTAAHCSIPSGHVMVVNAYTQYNYSRTEVCADYFAIRSCMCAIRHYYCGKRIGMPRIGAQLAGGDWKIIEAIIKEELRGEDVTIVNFKPQPNNEKYNT